MQDNNNVAYLQQLSKSNFKSKLISNIELADTSFKVKYSNL